MNVIIELQDDTTSTEIPSLSQFENWATQTFNVVPVSMPENTIYLTVRLIDKVESALLNQTYREKKGPTNILSFPDDPIPGFTTDSLGDLAICVPLVIEEAEKQGKPVEAHWAHLFIHGILHLLNYDHIKDEDADIMEKLEIEILQNLGYDNPY